MKRSSSSHVRVKIIALLAALAALWGFAAVVTVRDGLNVLYVSTVDREVARPTNLLVVALQQERRVSVAASGGDAETLAQLQAVRGATDQVVSEWRGNVASTSLEIAASGRLKERVATAADEVAALDQLRADIDEGSLGRVEVQAGFTTMIDAGFAIYAAVTSIDDQELARQARTLVTLTRAREMLSQQDALLAGALVQGEFSGADIAEFLRLVGTQRTLYDSVATELPPEEFADYQAFVASPAITELRRVEDLVIEQARPGAAPPVGAEDWQQTVEGAMGAIFGMEFAAADRTLARADSARTGVIIRLILAGGLGLIAVIAAIIVSITTARSLVRQLERLRNAARDLARNRLPRVVERLSAGEKVDVATEAPPLRFGNDEIGQVGQAFNAVQETAVRAAVQQAELRHGVRDVFLSLARRTQNLVHKQLAVVDGMERRETDADEMEELYRIDHLATRMRRNAENLIVLAGSTPGRVWRRPVPMVDVVRGAIAEVEDYQRINLLPVQSGAVEGRVAGDVIHLLAELVENAASFSPPYAMVSVTGQRVAHGFVVEIEDRGLGMSEGDLAVVNHKLAEPPDFNLADASRLGHYVVAKLAQRHGIRVHLRVSPYGGVTAIVLVPREIMVETPDEDPPMASAPPAAEPTSGGFLDPGGRPAAGAATTSELSDIVPASGPTVHFDDSITPPASQIVMVRQRDHGPASAPPSYPMVPPPSSPPASSPPVGFDTIAGPATATGPAMVEPAPNGPVHRASDQAGPAIEAEDAVRTPAGLPWRVRQASLPKQLWTDESAGDELPARDPEQTRQAMRSFQLGTQRGRSDSGDPSTTESPPQAPLRGAPPPPTEQANHQRPGQQPGHAQEG
jgi:HAMP domain-containing protein